MNTSKPARAGIHPGIIFAVLLALMVGGWFLWRARSADAPGVPTESTSASAPRSAIPAAPPASPPAPTIPLPAMAESDVWVREVVGRLSAHPKIASWLVTDELIARFVAAVDNVARGESPRTHLDAMAPEGVFEAGSADQTLTMSQRSQGRYDVLVTAIESLDTAGTAALLRQLEPLLVEAYRALGYPDGDFSAQLAKAIEVIQTTPVVESAALTRGVESFRFADPALEGLSDAQKHLVRMGPENTVRVQEKLRLISRAAGLANGG